MPGPDASLVAAIRAKENQPNDWSRQLAILLASLVLFIAVGLIWWNVRLVLMLVGILLLHEGGHYVAMRVFGYRNIRMVFVPMLGAAVSGHPLQLARWKKAVVYFAGPLPGIALSMGLLTIASLATMSPDASVLPVPLLSVNSSHPWLFELGGLGLLLNWMNLLPLLPLDGGKIVQSTFARPSPWREMLGRGLTILTIAALGMLIGEPVLLLLIVPLLFTMPLTYRTGWLSRQLSDREIAAPERRQIPESAITTIASAIDETALQALPPPQKASLVLQIYESLITPAPGRWTSWVISLVYIGSMTGSTLFGWWVWSRHRWYDPSERVPPIPAMMPTWIDLDKGSQEAMSAFSGRVAGPLADWWLPL
ncbi:Zn-dependent protease [Rhodopirellula islandica]|uniref:Zn-dependent protease n=1 Tax=Rhodopirellula islandica TaxID=595434 RepID=A0A0J1EKZ7_RHOIS|nr:peptidase M50 [Rhodopirellula islandica]KLU06229.1 Zn-dependent protease [Rhodopirellula islandica]